MKLLAMVALMAAGTLGELSAQVNGSWAAAKGSGVWSDSANWTGAPSPVPGGANSTVTLNTGLSSSITVTIDGAVGNRTVGILDFGLTRTFTVAGSSGGSLTFDNGASSAQINVAVGKNATISANTTLTSSVLITNVGDRNRRSFSCRRFRKRPVGSWGAGGAIYFQCPHPAPAEWDTGSLLKSAPILIEPPVQDACLPRFSRPGALGFSDFPPGRR
jgi:hypothetical protein